MVLPAHLLSQPPECVDRGHVEEHEGAEGEEGGEEGVETDAVHVVVDHVAAQPRDADLE